MSARQYRWWNWGLAVGLLAMLAAPQAVTVSSDDSRILLPGNRAVPDLCLTKRATGLECSSCHLGRSIVLAAQGEMARSMAHHPGGIVLVAWTAVQTLVRIALALAFAGLARYWWVDLTVTLVTLTSATVGIVAMA